MRRLFTTAEAAVGGVSESRLRWGVNTGKWTRIVHGVYGTGSDAPSEMDRARARVVASGGVASGRLAGVLHGLDAVTLGGAPTKGRAVGDATVLTIEGVRCVDAVQTLVDLAATMTDEGWEQALESALRKRLVTIDALVNALPTLGGQRVRGTARIRRVLARRPPGSPPTESLLETLMVQLVRKVPDLADPLRQVEIHDERGSFLARVDLAWPELGLFVELDGQQHAGQPVYDARRETAVVAATGWLCGRFTWHEVVHTPATTARNLSALARQGRRRVA